MKVRILRRAEADLLSIYRYIASDNPPAARSLTRHIRERCLGLADFPEQGRPASGGLRELVIAGTPYIAVYRIAGDTVRVLRVLHGKQQERD